MNERKLNLEQRELRNDAEALLLLSMAYDKRQEDKPGDFFNRIKHRLKHPSKLKSCHFPRYPEK